MRFEPLMILLLPAAGNIGLLSTSSAFVVNNSPSSSSSALSSVSLSSAAFAVNSKSTTLLRLAAAVSENEEESDNIKLGDSIQDDTVNIPVEPDSHEELMYALGVNLARQLGDIRPLVENGEELAQVAKGLLDTVVGRLNEEGQTGLLRKRGEELNELVKERALSLQKKLEERGLEMLENMAETEGVQTLDNNVVLHVLEDGPDGPGQGARPTIGSTVLIHYHGTLPDGTVFDSTLGGEPVKMPLAQVIPGWRDGVLAMHEGETAMLGVPPDQAYGDNGTPDGRIPGGSTLFFKVQLVKVLNTGIGGTPSLLGPDGKPMN